MCFSTGGLETEKEYKYVAHDEKCFFKKREVAVYINGSVAISKDEGGNGRMPFLVHKYFQPYY